MNLDNKTSKSTLIVKSIGIPDVCNPLMRLRIENVPTFLQIAEKNKIPLFFLRRIGSGVDASPCISTLLRYEQRYQKTFNLVKFVAGILEKEKISYTFFKTLKPFPYVPSDVDILLWSNKDLKTLEERLKSKDCISLKKDAYGLTMFSPSHNLNIDLTTQIAVSGMVYINKELIFDHVKELDVYGNVVRTLEPSAELLAVIAHSVFKEQMFTLSDYYTLVLLAKHWEEASKLAGKLHLKSAFETVLRLTETVTLNAFGSLTPLFKKFIMLGIRHNSTSYDKAIELPKKYDLSTIVVELFTKVAIDPIARSSLFSVARSFYNPSFYQKMVEHITRENY